MTDLWGFLLQTLTGAGAAALLLAVKAMFRDKLSPRWQFAAWGVPALVLLVPAGWGGRYVLIDWPLLVEAAKTALTGDYSLTRVLAPVPLPRLAAPEDVWGWLYAVYVAGVLVLLARYLLCYLRLRLALRRGAPAGAARRDQIEAVARRYGLRSCRAVEVPGLHSAFVCGVFRPVLALPAGAEVDDKVLLHELLHRGHRDAAWGILICLFRCLHWCDPLLWTCAGRAANDLEELCDQRVLELLEGEQRREYGRILLSMADEKYASTPGTSSMANGGKNIRRRIEAIARSKRYPAGMALVSVCMVVLLAAPLLLGTRAGAIYDRGEAPDGAWEIPLAMASARTLRCTGPAGALDAYARSVLDHSGYCRALCAPLSEHEAIAAHMRQRAEAGQIPLWDSGLPAAPDPWLGYGIYGLERLDQDAYEGLLAVPLAGAPDGETEGDGIWLGVQRVRARRQEGRWVVLPLEDFGSVQTRRSDLFLRSDPRDELPTCCYEARAEGFTVRLRYQSVLGVDSSGPESARATCDYALSAVYTGEAADRDSFRSIGVSVAPLWEDGERPALRRSGGSSFDGASWSAQSLEEGWGPEVHLGGGGSSVGGSLEELIGARENILPPAYAADLYLNGELAAELTLLPVEGGGAT